MFNFCPNIQYNSCPGRGGKVGEERGGWRCFRSHCLKSFSFCNCVFYGPSVYCFLKCIKINELNCCCEALKWFAAAKMSPLLSPLPFPLLPPSSLLLFCTFYDHEESAMESKSKSLSLSLSWRAWLCFFWFSPVFPFLCLLFVFCALLLLLQFPLDLCIFIAKYIMRIIVVADDFYDYSCPLTKGGITLMQCSQKKP